MCMCVCTQLLQSCLTLCDPMDCSMPGFTILHYLPEFAQIQWANSIHWASIESVMPSNHLVLCCPLLLLPSIFSCIRVFSIELTLRIRWPKYWWFSFNISPSSEYSGLMSFRMDWVDLLAVQVNMGVQVSSLALVSVLCMGSTLFCT